MTPELNLFYCHSGSTGYGLLGTHLHRSLGGIGVDVYDHLPGVADLTKDRKKSGLCATSLSVMHSVNVRTWADGQDRNLFTMWETQRLPESLRNLSQFRTVLVPSQHNVELFSQYHDNVRYVPLGVDPLRWRFITRKDPSPFFNFLVAGSGPRKGFDLAVAAFQKLFPSGAPINGGPIPRLIVKSPRGEDIYGAGIEQVTGRIAPDAEESLYADAHCFLAPARGEGWGLQPLQAIASGCPTILTDAHGHEAFAQYGLGLGATTSKAEYELFGDSGDWWEPDFSGLCSLMEYVYDNWEFEFDRAPRAAAAVLEEFTWDRTADKTVMALGGTPTLERQYQGDGKIVVDNANDVPIIAQRTWVGDVAGVTQMFHRGELYHVSPYIKKILAAAGVLDHDAELAAAGMLGA